MNHRTLLTGLTVSVLLIGLAVPGVATAQKGDEGTDSGDDSPVVNIDIDMDRVVDAILDLIDELSDFTGSFSELLTEVLFAVFFQPFLDLLRAAAIAVMGLMVWLPDPTIDEVLSIHKDVYLISLALGSAGFTVIGFAYMGYEPFGIPYSRVRPLIPRLLAALVFGAIAPWLLQYPVHLAEASAAALAPANPSFTGLVMLSGEIILVSIVEAFVVLALIVVFWVQKIYILFTASTASLIAVLWAIPFRYTQRIAERLIGAFWGFLLIGPLDIIVFRLTVSLLSLESFDAASWMVGLGGMFLLLGIPFIVVSAGMSAAAPALAAARGTVSTVSRIDYEFMNREKVRQTSLDEYGSIGRGSGRGRASPTRGDRENPYKTGNLLDGDRG